MYIDDTVRKLLLDPMLAGSLSIAVDEFVLQTNEGPIPLAATLLAEPVDNSFRLEVRDSKGRDLSGFFTTKNKVTEDDTLHASGTIGSYLRVEFCKVWPPTSSTIRPIGDVQSSSAILTFSKLVLPATAADSQTHDEIRETLNRLNPHHQAIPVSEEPNRVEQEHIAVFANTKLMFVNCGTEWTESHPFWGKKRGTSGSTWEGSAMGGTFSLKQAGEHLEVGFRHECDNDEEARLRFEALVQAVAYTHAIFPWPSFIQRRRNWKITEQWFKVVRQAQGSMFPLRKVDGFTTPSAPTDLISSVAALFFMLPAASQKELKQAMWVFRGADSQKAPLPLQIAMICSVIEGLRTELFQEQDAPAVFSELKEEALAWIKESEHSSTNSERIQMLTRLKVMIKNWNYQDRRVEWNDVFSRLFPGREKWVIDMFKLFNNHRHGPAHGKFGSTIKGEPHASGDALGPLAGFVNMIIAARAGYVGPILESPYADSRINLGP